VTALPDSTDYQVTIAVLNSFSMTVSATVTQTLPSTFTILDAGNAQISDRTLVWSETLEPQTAVELRVLMRWEALPGQAVSVPAPVLSFRDASTGLGDTYVGSPESVTAVWPLELDYHIPATWQIGEFLTIPVTVTNTSAGLATQGTFTCTVTTVDGEMLRSIERPLDVPAGGTEHLSLEFAVPAQMGYAVISGTLNVGGAQREFFQEVPYIRGLQTYLPLVLRN
jgi:hypothetical protein